MAFSLHWFLKKIPQLVVLKWKIVFALYVIVISCYVCHIKCIVEEGGNI